MWAAKINLGRAVQCGPRDARRSRVARGSRSHRVTARGALLFALASLALAACSSETQPGQSDTGGGQLDGSTGDDTGVVLEDGTVPPSDSGPTPSKNCGNGKLDANEDCDGQELNGMTCGALGYTGGTLKCSTACTLDPSACQGTPTGRQFGQTCSETIGECAEGLVCVVETQGGTGFCTADCTSTDCPALPKGAECMFSLQDGRKVCGFGCSADNMICPPELGCVSDPSGNYYCSTNKPAVCGDGQVEGAEDCDGTQLGGKDCKALGYDGGTLKCSAKCALDTSACTGTPAGVGFGGVCGDGIADCLPGFSCVIASTTGEKKGFCTQECSDTKPCPSSPPGAGCVFQLTDGTQICGFLCDPGTCPPGLTCSEFGGGYACTTDPPPVCGDGKIGNGEECDGTALNNMSCTSFGYGGGTLKCTSCKFDKSGCTGQTSCSPPPLVCSAGNAACGKLELFDPPTGPGYIRGHYPDWSWLRHDAIMVYKYAAASLSCLMPGSLPIHTFDMSDKNGSTPRQDNSSGLPCFTTSNACGARHPESTHNYGLDIDSSYMQTSGMNNPGPVCKHTTAAGAEAYHCTGSPLPPDGLLDVTRTTLMIGKILESSRIRVIGVDGQVGGPLQAEAQKLAQQGLITTSALNAFKQRLAFEVTDQQMGWYLFHHHHFHTSFLNTAYPTPSTPAPGALPWADQGTNTEADAASESLKLDGHALTMVDPAIGPAGPALFDSKLPLVQLDDPYRNKSAPPKITVERLKRPLHRLQVLGLGR